MWHASRCRAMTSIISDCSAPSHTAMRIAIRLYSRANRHGRADSNRPKGQGLRPKGWSRNQAGGIRTRGSWMQVRAVFAALALCIVVPMLSRPLDAQAPGTTAKRWSPPRTPWGDPDLQGTYANDNEYATPLERPREFDGKTLTQVTADETGS